MISSGVWAGQIPLSKAQALREVPTVASLPTATSAPETMQAALERIGYKGTIPCSHTAVPMAGHFEVHIEQGPHLIAAGQRIGVVTGVQAYRWYRINVNGREAHTGSTAFQHRADALYAAAKMMVCAREVAQRLGCLASVGIVDVKPSSVNTLPGFVSFSLDIRAPETEMVVACDEQLRKDFAAIAAEEGKNIGKPCSVSWQLDSDTPKVKFNDICIECVTESTNALLAEEPEANNLHRTIQSGAGHDSVYTSTRVPTSMIFVPCKDGLSHHPEEYSTPENCVDGATVVLQSVVRYDYKRFQQQQ